MNRAIAPIIIRFFVLVFLQGLVLKELSLQIGNFPYFQILLYPLFILVIPFSVSRPLQLFLAFLLGLFVDSFYDSPGIHASAAVFTAFVRPFVLSWFEPREGYNAKHNPTKNQYGLLWFTQYGATLMAIHLFTYFSVEAFTFYYIVDILLKTISSFFITMLFVFMAIFLDKN